MSKAIQVVGGTPLDVVHRALEVLRELSEGRMLDHDTAVQYFATLQLGTVVLSRYATTMRGMLQEHGVVLDQVQVEEAPSFPMPSIHGNH